MFQWLINGFFQPVGTPKKRRRRSSKKDPAADAQAAAPAAEETADEAAAALAALEVISERIPYGNVINSLQCLADVRPLNLHNLQHPDDAPGPRRCSRGQEKEERGAEEEGNFARKT